MYNFDLNEIDFVKHKTHVNESLTLPLHALCLCVCICSILSLFVIFRIYFCPLRAKIHTLNLKHAPSGLQGVRCVWISNNKTFKIDSTIPQTTTYLYLIFLSTRWLWKCKYTSSLLTFFVTFFLSLQEPRCNLWIQIETQSENTLF